MIKLASGFGSTAMAGYTIAIRLAIFAFMPAFGLGGAAATLVGQSLGAGMVLEQAFNGADTPGRRPGT